MNFSTLYFNRTIMSAFFPVWLSIFSTKTNFNCVFFLSSCWRKNWNELLCVTKVPAETIDTPLYADANNNLILRQDFFHFETICEQPFEHFLRSCFPRFEIAVFPGHNLVLSFGSYFCQKVFFFACLQFSLFFHSLAWFDF
jgi:hypothetical protein